MPWLGWGEGSQAPSLDRVDGHLSLVMSPKPLKNSHPPSSGACPAQRGLYLCLLRLEGPTWVSAQPGCEPARVPSCWLLANYSFLQDQRPRLLQSRLNLALSESMRRPSEPWPRRPAFQQPCCADPGSGSGCGCEGLGRLGDQLTCTGRPACGVGLPGLSEGGVSRDGFHGCKEGFPCE